MITLNIRTAACVPVGRKVGAPVGTRVGAVVGDLVHDDTGCESQSGSSRGKSQYGNGVCAAPFLPPLTVPVGDLMHPDARM